MVGTIATVIPDNQSIQPSYGANFSFKVVPKIPIVLTDFDCSGYDDTPEMELAPNSTGPGPLTNFTLPLTATSADATGIQYEILGTDLATLYGLAQTLSFNGYINAKTAGGSTALAWTGQFGMRANAAQLNGL